MPGRTACGGFHEVLAKVIESPGVLTSFIYILLFRLKVFHLLLPHRLVTEITIAA
jgi:hypothetical protein